MKRSTVVCIAALLLAAAGIVGWLLTRSHAPFPKPVRSHEPVPPAPRPPRPKPAAPPQPKEPAPEQPATPRKKSANPLLRLLEMKKGRRPEKPGTRREPPTVRLQGGVKEPKTGPEKPDSDKPDPKLERILDKMEKARGGINRVEADLVKTRVNRVISDVPDKYVGRLKFQTPRFLMMELKGPFRAKPADQRVTRTIVAERFAYIWRVEDNEAERFKLPGLDEKRVSERNPLEYGLAASIRNLKRDYYLTLLGEEKINGRRTFQVRARPRPTVKDPPYSKLVFWVAEGMWVPLRVRQVKSDGEIVDTYQLSKVKLNPRWLWSNPFKPPPSSVNLIRHDLARPTTDRKNKP